MTRIKQMFYIKFKKIHNPYKYLKKNYPEIKNNKIYDFILESIQFIEDFYKLKRKPFGKYVPHLYNFYRQNDTTIPIINKFKTDKNLILEKEIIDKLNELSNNKKISKIIKSKNNKKPTIGNEILNKYNYFNKSENNYFKKLRYCCFDDCYKIANFKDTSNNKKYDNIHINNDVVNINNRSNFSKCKYNNCKKNINSDFNYCQNHKFVCKKNNCNKKDLFVLIIDNTNFQNMLCLKNNISHNIQWLTCAILLLH